MTVVNLIMALKNRYFVKVFYVYKKPKPIKICKCQIIAK